MEIYLDENLSEYVADALNSLNRGYFNDVKVNSTKIAFGKGILDEALIPKIGSIEGILVSRDIRIANTRLQFELLKKHELGAFFITLPKGMNKHWELVKLLVKFWEEIIRISKKKKKPFAYRIMINKMVEL